MPPKNPTLPQFLQKSTHQSYRHTLFWIIGVILAILLATTVLTRPEQTLLLIAALILALFVAKNLKLGLYIIIFLPVIGEMIRLPIGPADGILISDLFIPVFLAIWITKTTLTPNPRTTLKAQRSFKVKTNTTHPTNPPQITTQKAQKNHLTLPFTLFIIIATLSLLQSLLFLTPSETLSGSLYLFRYLIYGLLYFATFQIIKTDKSPEKTFQTTLKLIVTSALLLVIAGFIQLQIYPDLAELEELGWDPHINRMVSTWLDPNFLGGLLAFITSILIGITLYTKKLAHKIGLLTIIAIFTTAIFLTYSRSAYLSLAAGLTVISLLKSRKILIIALILAIIGIASSERAQQRTTELAQSVTAIFTESAKTPDPTAKLRIKSWQQTLYLIQKRPLLGSGYNTLRSVNHREGFVTDTSVHSASGSDSSLLTILATTGILGFIPFLLLYILSLKTAFKNWRNKKLPPLSKGYSLGILGGITALLIHSLFVNSLLFPQILIFFWICIALLEYSKNPLLNNTKVP